MSLLNIVSHIEQERNFNRALMNSLIADLDADIRRLTGDFDANIQRLTERKASIIEEFEERDAGFARLIDGDTARPAVASPAYNGAPVDVEQEQTETP